MYAPIQLLLSYSYGERASRLLKRQLNKSQHFPRLCNHHPLKRHLGLGQDFISLCVTHSNYGQDQTDCDTLGKSSTIQMNYVLLFITLFCTRDATCRQTACRFKANCFLTSVNSIKKWYRMDFLIHNQVTSIKTWSVQNKVTLFSFTLDHQ